MKNRDGLTLYADIVRPDAPGRYPVLVSRTPYGKDTAMQNTDGSAFLRPQRLCHGDSGLSRPLHLRWGVLPLGERRSRWLRRC